MNKYIIHDVQGFIISCGSSQDKIDQRISLDHTQLWMDFPPDIENYRINGDALVRIPDSDITEREEQAALALFRSLRDGRLDESDWTQVPDAPVDQAAWATYRQQLRDLPANTDDPANPVWPLQPS